MQKVLQTMHKDSGMDSLGRKTLEINPKHPLIKRLAKIKDSDGAFAKMIAEQILDTTLISPACLSTRKGLSREYIKCWRKRRRRSRQ